MRPIKRALISVSDKRGIVEFARGLHALGVTILSTGGTARLLHESGLAVTEVSDYTGFPEMMDGRLKTLHPKIHGGLLGRRGRDDAAMAANGIAPIDMVVVNLYPFEQTTAQPGCTLADAVEQIDIGGPTMIRAAAKNHDAVAAVVDSADYGAVMEELQSRGGALGSETRFHLAVKAFEHTARYDGVIANYLGGFRDDGTRGLFPRTYNSQYVKIEDLRYGENPHQHAAFYRDSAAEGGGVAGARQAQGKPLSFNNIADADTALECVREFAQGPACVIVKHANPCGVALGATLEEAYRRAYQTDPVSAFGGVIAFNGELDAAAARAILEQQFVEVIIAPGVAAEALAVLGAKPNVRVLDCAAWGREGTAGFDLKRVSGGLLVQDRDCGRVGPAELKAVTRRAPTAREVEDLLFAWRVAKFVKSNAIVYGRDGMTIGIGAGQMSRVYSARIAALKAADAGLEVAGSVMASDAFFPFRDGLDSAAAAGVRAVIQPGGSQRDREVIAAADEHGIAMVFTGMRHFRH